MKFIREASHQDVQRTGVPWRRRAFEVRARDGMLARLFQEKSAGKSREALGQFASFCVVGMSNAVTDFGVLNAALAAFPTQESLPLLADNSAAVMLAATNSFVWNRRFTFRVRGPLQADEVVRFAVVVLSTAGLNDLVLLALSGLFPALRASGAALSERAQAGSHPGRSDALIFRHAFLGVSRQKAVTWPPCKSERVATIVQGQNFKRLSYSRIYACCFSRSSLWRCNHESSSILESLYRE